MLLFGEKSMFEFLDYNDVNEGFWGAEQDASELPRYMVVINA